MKPKSGRGGPSRPPQAAVHPVYEDFRPAFERQREDETEKLHVYLPEFSKENIRVSTEGKNTVRIGGEHLVGDNRWKRFQEDFLAPEDCNMTKIRASFENGILTITMPTPTPTPDDEFKQTQNPSTIPPVTSQNTSEGEGKEKVELHKPPTQQQDSPPNFISSPMHSESQENEDKAKQKEKDEREIRSSNAWNYMEAIQSSLTQLQPYEKRQLLMSAGAAVIFIVSALGAAYISLHYTHTS